MMGGDRVRWLVQGGGGEGNGEGVMVRWTFSQYKEQVLGKGSNNFNHIFILFSGKILL